MYDKYFSYTYMGDSFELFSQSHLIMLVILIMMIVLLVLFRKHLRKHSTFLRFSLIALLVISEGSLNVWYVTSRAWDVKETLPLQLCTISLLLCIVMLAKRSYKLFEIVYFLGIGGAIQALLTPELYFDFPHYRYFHFFIAHITIVLAALYMIFIEKCKPTIKSFWKSMIVLNVIALIIFFINKMVGANYLFLAHKPENASILDFFPDYPWYIIYLEFVAFILFFLFYLPFSLKRIKKIKNI